MAADVQQTDIGSEADRHPVDDGEVPEEVPDLQALPKAHPRQLAAKHQAEVVGVHVGGDEEDECDRGDQH